MSTSKIFVSSTIPDLKHHREAVRDAILALDMLPVMSEHFAASSQSPVDAMRQKIAACDVFIGIYANRYGDVSAGYEVSLTELAYDAAQESGLDCLIFVLDDAEGFPLKHPIRAEADAERDPRYDAFLQRLRDNHHPPKFGEADNLAHKVTLALVKWQQQHSRATAPEPSPAVRVDTGHEKDSEPLPFWAQMVRLALSLLTLLAIGNFFRLVLEAGNNTVGVFTGLLGLALTILPLFSSYVGAFEPLEFLSKYRGWKWGVIIAQAVALIAIVLGSQSLLDTLADNELEDAFSAGSVADASQSLDSAEVLGADVTAAIREELYAGLEDANISAEDQVRVRRNAVLYADYAPESDRDTVASDLAERARVAAENDQFEQALLLTVAVIEIDQPQGGALVSAFNDIATDAFAANPPDLTEAHEYFELVRQIDADETLSTDRTPEQQSVSRYNLAVIRDILAAGDPEQLDEIITLYEEAIGLNDANIEARYALSSLLLIEFADDESRLRRAVELAEAGHERYIDEQFCAGSQNLSDEPTLLNSWYCFLLRTTEAGARLAIGGETNQAEARSLVERATRLAEANDQFGRGRFTAEAYYYQAQISDDDAKCAALLQIIPNHDRNNSRHREWVVYANTELDARDCE